MKIRSLAAVAAFSLLAGAASAQTPALPAPHPTPDVTTTAPALDRLMAVSPGATLQRVPFDGSPALIVGLSVATSGADWSARALDFVTRWPVLPAGASSLRVAEVRSLAGRHSVTLAQSAQGVHVFERSAVITMDDAGKVVSLTSSLIKLGAVARGDVAEQAARASAAKAVFGDGADASVSLDAARVIIASVGQAEEVWMVSLSPAPPLLRPLVFVSTTTGRVVGVRDHSAR